VIDWSEHDECMTRPSDAGVDRSLDGIGRRPQIWNVTSDDSRDDPLRGQ